MVNQEPISIIIPAYNEQTSIGRVITQIKNAINVHKYPYEIIVVDDGSTDNTASIVSQMAVTLLRSDRNMGYGLSLKTGIFASKNDIIVIIDSDGTYPPEHIPHLVDEMITADMVVGSRTGQDVSIPFIRKPAKWILRHLAQYITGQHIPDLNSGLRVFRKTVAISYMPILSDEFSFTTSLTVALLSHKYRVKYIPINYFKRIGKSKVMPRHFLDFIILVLRLSMRFNPLKVFVPIALLCFTIGIIKFGIDLFFVLHDVRGITIQFLTHKVISQSTLMLWLAGLQILLVGMVADGIILNVMRPYSPANITPIYPHMPTAVNPNTDKNNKE